MIIIDRFYPSSQLCSCCGHRQPMPLKLRIFNCGNCGLSIDRDLNAAINIRDYPEKAASSVVSACGLEDGLGVQEKPLLREEAGMEQQRRYSK